MAAYSNKISQFLEEFWSKDKYAFPLREVKKIKSLNNGSKITESPIRNDIPSRLRIAIKEKWFPWAFPTHRLILFSRTN